jgi:hypothetical protein
VVDGVLVGLWGGDSQDTGGGEIIDVGHFEPGEGADQYLLDDEIHEDQGEGDGVRDYIHGEEIQQDHLWGGRQDPQGQGGKVSLFGRDSQDTWGGGTIGGTIEDGHFEPSEGADIDIHGGDGSLLVGEDSGGGGNIIDGHSTDPSTDTQQQSLLGQGGRGQGLQEQGGQIDFNDGDGQEPGGGDCQGPWVVEELNSDSHEELTHKKLRFSWAAGVAVMMAIMVYTGIGMMGHMIGGYKLRLDLYKAEGILLRSCERSHLPDVGGLSSWLDPGVGDNTPALLPHAAAGVGEGCLAPVTVVHPPQAVEMEGKGQGEHHGLHDQAGDSGTVARGVHPLVEGKSRRRHDPGAVLNLENLDNVSFD